MTLSYEVSEVDLVLSFRQRTICTDLKSDQIEIAYGIQRALSYCVFPGPASGGRKNIETAWCGEFGFSVNTFIPFIYWYT